MTDRGKLALRVVAIIMGVAAFAWGAEVVRQALQADDGGPALGAICMAASVRAADRRWCCLVLDEPQVTATPTATTNSSVRTSRVREIRFPGSIMALLIEEVYRDQLGNVHQNQV